MTRLALIALLFVLASTGRARAHVERFALVIGNNQGDSHETELRYAESDAGRMYAVLRELGGFEPVNMVLLRGEDASTATSTLIALNQRIRDAAGQPDTQTLLFVYYSGHADASALHLGASRVGLRDVSQLVRGSAATFRMLVVDACRSGALTRVKGGKVVAPIDLPEEPGLSGEGFAFLTASAADEDAQESDEVKGSFFTHALVSGLLGAADRDGDGDIVLDEAYRYAYDATLRASSRTYAGLQHPTFHYDFRGQGDLVITQPQAYRGQRGSLRFKPGIAFLLLRGSDNGPVVAEISANDARRTLSLAPGSYFVRGRGPDYVLEGSVEAVPGSVRDVSGDGFQRIDYARLVRKGAGDRRVAHGLEAGARVRSALPNGEGPCFGGFAGYALEFQHLGVRTRLGGCRNGYQNEHLSATTAAYDAELRLAHAWDVSRFSLDLGLGAGGVLFIQHFETGGEAPSRRSIVPFVEVAAGAAIDLSHGVYVSADVTGATYFFTLESGTDGESEASVNFALQSTLGVGKHF